MRTLKVYLLFIFVFAQNRVMSQNPDTINLTNTALNKFDFEFRKKGTQPISKGELIVLNIDAGVNYTIKYGQQTITPSVDGNKATFDLKNALLGNNTNLALYGNDKLITSINYKIINEVSDAKKDTTDEDLMLSGMLSANFIGKTKVLSTVTPIVSLGKIVSIGKNSSLLLNPYLGSDLDATDVNALAPTLVLPGKAGFTGSIILNSSKENRYRFYLNLLTFGFKFLDNVKVKDNTVIQHYLRTGITFQLDNDLLIQGTYSYAWHNLTSESKSAYKTAFGQENTEISYIGLSLQVPVISPNSDKTNYIYFEWRNLLTKGAYESLTNRAFLLLGFRKDIGLLQSQLVSATKSKKKIGNGKFYSL